MIVGPVTMRATTLLALLTGAGCASSGGLELGAGGTPTATLSDTTSSAPTSTGNTNGVGEACPHPIDRFSFQITADGSDGLGCGVGTGTLGVTATVTAVDPDLAYMELATQGPECTGSLLLACPGLVRLYIGSLDFTLPIIPGADVTLVADVYETPYGCSQTLAVVNLPNAHYPQTTVWFAGADGTLGPPLDGQIQAEEAPGCGAGSHPGFVDESITLSIPSASPDTVTLAAGDLRVIPGTTWAVKNLRSFRTVGAPAGDTHDFAFWAAYEAPPAQ